MTTTSSFFTTETTYSSSLFELGNATLLRFKQITRQYALFHISFFALAFLELVTFVLFFSFFTQTTLLAFSLAGMFLTAFTYFVLLFYLQAKKPQELKDLLAQFAQYCGPLNVASLHPCSFMIQSLYHLFVSLHKQEYTYYNSFASLTPLMQKFSAWIHWRDLHQINEMILHAMVKEHLKLIYEKPTDPALHASLAKTYQFMAELYTDPTELSLSNEDLWTSPEYQSAAFLRKRKQALLAALEEYKILDFYTPENPAVYEQLARIYYDLEDPQKAIHSYELIVRKKGDDNQALFDLGSLYFENGQYAQGLQVYEQLRHSGDPRSEELLSYYENSSLMR